MLVVVGVLTRAAPAGATTPLTLGVATTITSTVSGQYSTPTNTCAVLVNALGGAGGAGFTGQGFGVYMTGAPGGAGGYLSTLLPLGAAQTLTVQVATGGATATSGGGAGGSPGGGSGFYDGVNGVGAGGGGGESTVTLGATTEVIASGGGGGTSDYVSGSVGTYTGGAGGVGPSGNGSGGATFTGTPAVGGSQSGGGGGATSIDSGSSGSSNQGGNANGEAGYAGGGGGAGYWGGGGGAAAASGAGGSNFVVAGALTSNGPAFTPPSQSNGEVVLTPEECQTITPGAGPTSPVVGGHYIPLPSATSSLAITETIDSSTSSDCSIAAGVVSFNTVGNCEADETQGGSSSWEHTEEEQQT